MVSYIHLRLTTNRGWKRNSASALPHFDSLMSPQAKSFQIYFYKSGTSRTILANIASSLILYRYRSIESRKLNTIRLIDTTSLELQEFIGDDIPEYAILSHTWGEEEVSFQDIQTLRASEKAGYAKIIGSCKQAVADKLDYIWIDTCCIDKSSSAELTEATNSMCRWYQNAEVCYVYLADVSVEDIVKSDDDEDERDTSSFSKSRWFTRGWTLQELIALSVVVFYSKDWQILGVKFHKNIVVDTFRKNR
jgi:hypothetical protein